MTMEQLLFAALSAAGVIIMTLASIVAQSLLKRFDNITAQLQKLNNTLASFVKKEECRQEMGDQCVLIEKLDKRITKNENALGRLEAQVKVLHKDDL